VKKRTLFIFGAVGGLFLIRPAYYAFIFNPKKNIDACRSIWSGKLRSEIEKTETIFADDGVLYLVDYCGKKTRTYLDFEGFPFRERLKKYWIQFQPKASILDVKRISHHYGIDSAKITAMEERDAIVNEKVQLFKDVNGEYVLSFKK
jgi:hypothetical protein